MPQEIKSATSPTIDKIINEEPRSFQIPPILFTTDQKDILSAAYRSDLQKGLKLPTWTIPDRRLSSSRQVGWEDRLDNNGTDVPFSTRPSQPPKSPQPSAYEQISLAHEIERTLIADRDKRYSFQRQIELLTATWYGTYDTTNTKSLCATFLSQALAIFSNDLLLTQLLKYPTVEGDEEITEDLYLTPTVMRSLLSPYNPNIHINLNLNGTDTLAKFKNANHKRDRASNLHHSAFMSSLRGKSEAEKDLVFELLSGTRAEDFMIEMTSTQGNQTLHQGRFEFSWWMIIVLLILLAYWSNWIFYLGRLQGRKDEWE